MPPGPSRATPARCGSVRTAYAAYAVLGLLVFAVGSLASPLIPAILGLEGDAARTSIVICVVLSIDLAVVTATGGWVGTLRGGRRFDLICAASVVHVAVSVPATILLVPSLGLPGAALAQLGGRLAGRLVAAIALVRTFPTITPRPGRVTRSDARILGLFALPVLAAGISTQLGIGADPIIVGLAAGPAAVGLYAAGSSIVRYAAFLLLPVVAVLLPSFAELGYTRPAEIAPTVLRCTRIAAAIGVIAFGSMAVSATPLLLAWIGEADNLSVNVLVLYALAHVAWVPSQVLVMALVAAGRHGPVGVALLIDAIINVVVSIALVVLIGPIGAAISSFVMLTAVHGVVIPLIASRRLPMPKPALALSLGKGGLSGLLVVMLVATVPAEGLAGLIAARRDRVRRDRRGRCVRSAHERAASRRGAGTLTSAWAPDLSISCRGGRPFVAVPGLDPAAEDEIEPAVQEREVHDDDREGQAAPARRTAARPEGPAGRREHHDHRGSDHRDEVDRAAVETEGERGQRRRSRRGSASPSAGSCATRSR